MFDIANNTEFMTAIGASGVPEDAKSELVKDIEELAQERLITKISDRLTDEQAEELNQTENKQQAIEWLSHNIPDFSNIVAGIIAEIQDEIIKRKINIMER